MKPSEATRTLRVTDTSTLREMLFVFAAAFEDEPTYCSAQPDDEYLGRLLANENFLAVATFQDDVVIGGLTGYTLPKFEQARSEFYIYDLAVDPHYRRQGVATALIEFLKGIAVERGIYSIFVQAEREDEAAIALYSKLGVREDVIHFDLL